MQVRTVLTERGCLAKGMVDLKSASCPFSHSGE